MLDKLFDRLDKKRDSKITITEYGVYGTREVEAIYSDSNEEYETRERKTRNLSVSTVNSFIDFINEELNRAKNKTGKKTTVTINGQGGFFSADDDFKGITCQYTRSLTEGWKALKNVANCKIGHEQLLTTLQKLRPYIENFEGLYLTLLDIRAIGRSEMISNPVFFAGDDGSFGASSGYKITYKLQSGTQEEVNLPNRFVVTLPYARGRQEVTYNVPVELMYLNNGNGRIEILFQIPELVQIEEEALQEESDYLKGKLSVFTELLVLLNY